MTRASSTKPKISSFAAPTEEDIAAFEALPEEKKRRVFEAAIEKGLAAGVRKVTPEDIIATVVARQRSKGAATK